MTPSQAKPRRALQKQHGEGRQQEQGLEAALPWPHQTRPSPPSRAGAAKGKDKLASAHVRPRWLVLGGRPQIPPEPKAAGQRRCARDHPYISHARLRCCSNAAGHRDFFGVSFLKQNYFAAPPSPAAFHWLHSPPRLPSAHHSKTLPFFLPPRAKPSRMPTVSAPEPRWPSLRHSSTPRGHGERLKPWGGRGWHQGTPQTVCLSGGDGGSFQSHQPIRKHLPHTASGESQER